jgi:regulator of sigma D
MITYKEFLNYYDVITEEEFNKAIKLVPEINSITLSNDIIDVRDAEDLCKLLIDTYLESISVSAYVEDIFLSEMKIWICDIETKEEAKVIFEKLSSYGWNIVNYNDTIDELNKFQNSTLLYDIHRKLSCLSRDKLEKINTFISELYD